jgi:two-component system chemotaxis response regulator CheY
VDLLKEIKKLDQSIKVVMLSGISNAMTVSEAKKEGADDFISKPFYEEGLKKTVEKFLGTN